MPFTTIQPGEIGDCIDRIGRQWMLITAGDEQRFNTMTASWGGMGTLFNKPVATIYVRPQRYTYQFTEQQDTFSLCFFDPCYRRKLYYTDMGDGVFVDKSVEAANYPEKDYHRLYIGEIEKVYRHL